MYLPSRHKFGWSWLTFILSDPDPCSSFLLSKKNPNYSIPKHPLYSLSQPIFLPTQRKISEFVSSLYKHLSCFCMNVSTPVSGFFQLQVREKTNYLKVKKKKFICLQCRIKMRQGNSQNEKKKLKFLGLEKEDSVLPRNCLYVSVFQLSLYGHLSLWASSSSSAKLFPSKEHHSC